MLSKTLYMRGLQCPKSLWLDRKQPEVRTAPPPDLVARWDAGTEVGRYAQLLFPGGVEVPFNGRTKVQQLAQTRDLLAKGAQTIYEATFSSEGVLVRADILRKTRDDWELYEVKSASDVKPHFPDDVAIQYFVLTGCGIDLRRAFLVHIDTGYVRRGEIVPQELFAVQEVTDIVRGKQSAIPAEIARMRKVLADGLPAIDIGPHCTNPYECDFIDHCWRHIPEYSVFDLKGRGVDKWDLYRRGIVRMDDVPLEALNSAQRMLDLMVPFRRRDIYHWRMGGSYSLKNVLPVLVPQLSYEGMAIQEGKEASLAYLALEKFEGRKEREKAEEDLRAYCRQDTLGMVKLLEKMRELAK